MIRGGVGLVATLALGLNLAGIAHAAGPAAAPAPVASPLPADLNALLSGEGNGTVFHKDGVDERTARACRMQPQIDTWAEGSVIALENGSLVIYGHRLPYATLYARMMADVLKRTQGLAGEALAARVKAIRAEWQKKKFLADQFQTPESFSRMSFVLARGGRLALLDDDGAIMARVGGPLHMPVSVHGAPVMISPMKSHDSDEPVSDGTSATAQAAATLMATTPAQTDDDTESLHVGDKIRVGFDSKHRPPMAFMSYRTAKPSSVLAIDQEAK